MYGFICKQFALFDWRDDEQTVRSWWATWDGWETKTSSDREWTPGEPHDVTAGNQEPRSSRTGGMIKI